jgi:hypothetical protein
MVFKLPRLSTTLGIFIFMTNREQQTIDNLYKSVQDLRSENSKFREDITSQVNSFNAKIDQKHLPLNLEGDVVKAVQSSLAEGLSKALTGYNSPLELYAKNVVTKYQASIESIFNTVVDEGINSNEFKVRVREVLLHKIAKTVTSGIDGSIDKTVNLMKQDAIFRSKLTLAVNGLVHEFLNPKKETL